MPTPEPTYGPVPERVDLGGGVALEKPDVALVPQLVEVVNAELDHLRPWMPWAQAPVTLQTQSEFVSNARTQWAAGREFVYLLVRDREVLGAVGLHTRRGPGVLEIGYWLRGSEQGKGLATRAAQALVEVATAAGAAEIAICCDEANVRSAAVPRRLGFTLSAVEDSEPAAAAETGRLQVWTLRPDAHSG